MTITGDHVVRALEVLGFGDYVEEVKTVMEDHKKMAKVKKFKSSKSLDKLGIPQEELARQQKELFAKARDRANSLVAAPGEGIAAAPTITPTSAEPAASATSSGGGDASGGAADGMDTSA